MSKGYWFAAASCAVAVIAIAQATPQPSKTPAPAAATSATAAPSTAVEGGTPAWIKPETPEQRALRLGTPEDPGLDPDPKHIYYRFGKRYHIEKTPRRWAAYKDVDEGMVRPYAIANFPFEIYQQNDEFVWWWAPEPEDAQQAQATAAATEAARGPEGAYATYTDAQLAYLKKIQPEFQILNPPQSPKTIHFEEASDGLPTAGSWRNSLAVADMNEDGFPDIIVPPQRGGGGSSPIVFLGDGNGHWKIWDAKWPYGVQYGSVAAADFNKDGHMDLAFAVHLTGVRVMLGDGKGTFIDASGGLPVDDFPTRRLVVSDLDRDGWPDILAITEGPMPGKDALPVSKVMGYFNRKKGTEWAATNVIDPQHVVGGDYLAVGKFNDDKVPDFAGSSIFFQASELIYLSDGKGKWTPVKSDGDIVPFLSYYSGVVAAPFHSKKYDDVVMSYIRFWPQEVNPAQVPRPPLKSVVGLDRISFDGGVAKRTPILRAPGNRSTTGVGAGDFDGDGNLDIVYTPFDPREVSVLVGDGKGGFARARTDGIKAENNTNYDVIVADVNRDKRPDVILLYESTDQSSFGVTNGSIHVFLNRGAEGGAATAKTAKK